MWYTVSQSFHLHFTASRNIYWQGIGEMRYVHLIVDLFTQSIPYLNFTVIVIDQYNTTSILLSEQNTNKKFYSFSHIWNGKTNRAGIVTTL